MATYTSLYFLTFHRRTDTISTLQFLFMPLLPAFGTETADCSASSPLCLGGQETGASLTTVRHARYLRTIVFLKCTPATVYACLVSGLYVGKLSFKYVVFRWILILLSEYISQLLSGKRGFHGCVLIHPQVGDARVLFLEMS